jgi:hypothetical protein
MERSADKQQELNLFRNHMIEALPAKLQFFASLHSVVTLFVLMENLNLML